MSEHEMKQDEEWVTVARFPEPAEASVARMSLEAAGISAQLRGATANQLIPVAFESELQVSRADESAAREFLKAAETRPATMDEVASAEIDAENAAGE